MKYLKNILCVSLLAGASTIAFDNSVVTATRTTASNCALPNSPEIYKVSYFGSNSTEFVIYVEINSCTGISAVSMSINDSKGAQVKFFGEVGSTFNDGMPSRGSVLQGFAYRVKGLKSGRYSFNLSGGREIAGGARSLPSRKYGSFDWNSISGIISGTGSTSTSTTPAVVASGNAAVDACKRLPSNKVLTCLVNLNKSTTTTAPSPSEILASEPTTTTRATVAPTTTLPTTTTTTVLALSLESDSLSKTSMVLQPINASNSVNWTVRVRDPFGGRLTGSSVGARLCPATSSWPDGPGCTGATSIGQGNNVDRTYRFLFLISPSAPTGEWLGRIGGPVSGQPDIIGRSRITVTR